MKKDYPDVEIDERANIVLYTSILAAVFDNLTNRQFQGTEGNSKRKKSRLCTMNGNALILSVLSLVNPLTGDASYSRRRHFR